MDEWASKFLRENPNLPSIAKDKSPQISQIISDFHKFAGFIFWANSQWPMAKSLNTQHGVRKDRGCALSE
jgi:hypothetical protein